jgi:hypothetical protein
MDNLSEILTNPPKREVKKTNPTYRVNVIGRRGNYSGGKSILKR